MPEDQFDFMRSVLAAPSPVGLEAAMTHGVLQQRFEATVQKHGWAAHRFNGNAGVVWDSHPHLKGRPKTAGDPLTVMVCGHADKIRMQVRSIGSDGKVYINSDSFLPQTLIGNEVR